MTLSVAIVGSGPSGFYAAEALLRDGAAVQIDLIERLPSPFGLVRGGVAPDHQSTKQVSRAFERTALSESVRYFGNVEIGRDLSMQELRGLYDAVILAIGAPADRRLGIPGEDKTGVLGSAAFVGWYNGHPDFHDLHPPLDHERVVVVGNGNVALDVARVLVKTPAEMADSDIDEAAEAAIAGSAVREVVVLGRRGPAEAKFSLKELREMAALADAVPRVEPEVPAAPALAHLGERERRRAERTLASLRAFNDLPSEGKSKRVRFTFCARPAEVLGGERVEALRCERTRVVDGRAEALGEFFDIPCGLIVTAIGYRTIRIDGAPFDNQRGRLRNRDGRIEPGLYCVGWCKRGPVGVIGSNKADGEAVAAAVRAEAVDAQKPGRAGLEALLATRGVRWIAFPDWQRIDRAERAAAAPGAPRRKFVTVEDMLALLERGGARPARSDEAAGRAAAAPEGSRSASSA